MENKYLSYRGRPLVRCGNEIYFGNMSDKYIILIRETATKKFNDSTDIGARFEIELQFTDPDIKGRGKIVKSTEKSTFTDALAFAEAWLESYNG